MNDWSVVRVLLPDGTDFNLGFNAEGMLRIRKAGWLSTEIHAPTNGISDVIILEDSMYYSGSIPRPVKAKPKFYRKKPTRRKGRVISLKKEK